MRESEIDTAVKRLFTARFRLGMFDPPQDVPFARITFSEVDSEAHRALARQVARESIVLLKNTNGVLPLETKSKTIAVIGPNATMLESLEGNYNGQPTHPVLPLDGIESRFNKVLYAQGSSYVAGFPVVVPRTVLRTGNNPGSRESTSTTPTGKVNQFYQGRQASGLRLERRFTGRGHIRHCIQCSLERFHRRARRRRLRL